MREKDIRNPRKFDKYLKLLEQDVARFIDYNSLEEINCPCCGKNNFRFEFVKTGFRYVSCKACSTLFVNPRPSPNILKSLYSNSASSNFWVNEFFKPVTEARREKIFKPRAEFIGKLISKEKKLIIGDIGSGFGLFLWELKKILPGNRYIAIEPSLAMSRICKKNGLETIYGYFEGISNKKHQKFDLLTGFELFEHLFDPAVFLNKAYSMLKPQGFLFLTTLNGQGFDILLLWEKSKSLSPPVHLNFFNPGSIKILLERSGFDVLEVSTPGQLDWDIVECAAKEKDIDLEKFWNFLAKKGSRAAKEQLQDWLCRNNLSSHMRIVARRRV